MGEMGGGRDVVQGEEKTGKSNCSGKAGGTSCDTACGG